MKGSFTLRFFQCSILLLVLIWVGQSALAEDSLEKSKSIGKQNQSAKIESLAKIDEQFVVGRVLAIEPLPLDQALLKGAGMVSKRQLVTVEILEGQFKGLKVKIPNEITDNPAYNVEAKPGSEVILSVVWSDEKKPEVNIADYHRAPALGWLGLAF
jgi:hypothetical protein